MSRLQVDDRFSAALRAQLVARAQQQAPSRRVKLWIGAGTVAGAGLLGGVAASAAGLFPVPGSVVSTPVASTVAETRTGTATVDLGTPPTGATGIEMGLSCLSPGRFEWPDGAAMVCSAADAGNPTSGWSGYTMALAPGQHSITITAGPGNRWTLTARYVKQDRTAWGTNAKGQTYGAEIPGKGTPDLLAVMATNGQPGYVYSKDLNGGPQPTSPEDAAKNFSTPRPPRQIPVYLSDGETQIGVFEVGGSGGPAMLPRPASPATGNTQETR